MAKNVNINILNGNDLNYVEFPKSFLIKKCQLPKNKKCFKIFINLLFLKCFYFLNI